MDYIIALNFINKDTFSHIMEFKNYCKTLKPRYGEENLVCSKNLYHLNNLKAKKSISVEYSDL